MPKIATVVQLDQKEINKVIQEHAKSLIKADPGGSSIKWLISDSGGVDGAIIRFGSKVDEEAVIEEPEVVEEPEPEAPAPAPPKPSDQFGSGIPVPTGGPQHE